VGIALLAGSDWLGDNELSPLIGKMIFRFRPLLSCAGRVYRDDAALWPRLHLASKKDKGVNFRR
jgi:hypothetical protein